MIRRSLLVLSAMASASLAEPPAPKQPDIVVTGKDQAVIENFVREMTDPARTDQVPRWEDSVCSGVIGLDQDQAEAINGRIGQVASIAGLRLDKEGCHPSILILFSDDAEALARGFAKRYPRTLSRDGDWRLQAFAHSHRAVRWISQIDVGSYDGSPIVKGFGGEPDVGALPNSRIKMATRAVMSFMLIIVDAKQLGHVTVSSLSDYLAMVALTRPKFGSEPPQQSILSLFAGSQPAPGRLTNFDRSYLASLYKAPADMASNAQESTIRHLMKRDAPPDPASPPLPQH